MKISQFIQLIFYSIAVTVVLGCSNRPPVNIADISLEQQEVSEIVQLEDLALDFTPMLKQLSGSLVDDGQLVENHSFVSLEFSNSLQHENSLETILQPAAFMASIELGSFPIESRANAEHTPWKGFCSQVDKWAAAQFGIVDMEFVGNKRDHVKMNTSFVGQALGESVFDIRAAQHLIWEKQKGSQWLLTGWDQKSFDVKSAPRSMFENTTEQAFDPELHQSLTRSVHEEYLLNVLKTGITPVYDRKYLPFVDAIMNHASPSVSVVDINDDGFDDLFVSSRWSPPKLLVNDGDGSFSDRTSEWGIDIRGLVNCSVFVDFDNDGDKDCLIGRSLEPMLVLNNNAGKFEDVTWDMFNMGNRYFVSAISCTDVNRDGLLDFYLSTYGAAGDERSVDWRTQFLPQGQAALLREKELRDHMWVDFPGPPNILVMNRGDGKLEALPVDELVSQWHNSFQSAWCDFDSDGDDDLYVCNDFAPSGFLINETERGATTPVFSDGISATFVDGIMGFSMGASWGDFDSDGDFDLYISNMYSKAGKRIMKKMKQVDRRMKVSATGNYLYRNEAGSLKQIAGSKDDQIAVHQVGWSYGSQLVDLTNNGFPDIYAPSGFFTAPKTGERDVDM